MTQKYRGHTISESNTSTGVWRTCFGKLYKTTANLFIIRGPVVNIPIRISGPTSRAAAARMIDERMGHEQH